MKKSLTVFIGLMLCVGMAKAQTAKPDTTIYNVVETSATFPGGISELYKFIGANMVYPDAAKTANIQGRVLMSFVVEKEGSLSNFTILRGLSPEVNAEALRVMKLSPKWSPGQQGGQVVRQLYSIPISFTLKKDTSKASESETFPIVEIPGEYPGGMERFYAYVKKNMRPVGDGVNGTVRIRFVVEKDGTLSGFKIEQSLTPDADAEAMRLLKSTVKIWKPGLSNGEPVRQLYNIPIKFGK